MRMEQLKHNIHCFSTLKFVFADLIYDIIPYINVTSLAWSCTVYAYDVANVANPEVPATRVPHKVSHIIVLPSSRAAGSICEGVMTAQPG